MKRKKKINKLKVFLGVMIIILLIAISAGIYILVNNPDILKGNANNEEINNQNEQSYPAILFFCEHNLLF